MIYYVEDDQNIRELVVYALKQSGFEAVGFEDTSMFWRACEETLPKLVLLDIMMPGEDGLTVLKHMRQTARLREVPIIMLTAKTQPYDKVIGLDTGADDYVTKPFDIMELISRVRAVLRRYETGSAKGGVLSAGKIMLDPGRHIVTADGVEITLTHKEFSMLRHMMENPNIAFDRERLLEAIWGYDYFGGTRTIDVHIQTLRQKLGESGHIIETVRGVGYRIRR